jgi:hypothetical protein
MQLLDAFQSQQSNMEGIKSSGDLGVAHPLRLRLLCLQLGDLVFKRKKTPIHTLDTLLHLMQTRIPSMLVVVHRFSQKAQRVGQPKLALSK